MRMAKRAAYTVIKIIFLPVHLFLKAIFVIGTLITAVSSWVFYIVGAVFLLTTICSFGFELAAQEELTSMLVTSVCVLCIPVAAKILLTVVETLDSMLI